MSEEINFLLNFLINFNNFILDFHILLYLRNVKNCFCLNKIIKIKQIGLI